MSPMTAATLVVIVVLCAIAYGIGAFLGKRGEPVREWLETHVPKLLRRDPATLEEAIRRACEIKAAIVVEDELEQGRRALLNLGHTFGHAIEAGAGFGTVLHGEAVAAGLVLAAELSARTGRLPGADALRVRELLASAGLPVDPPRLG